MATFEASSELPTTEPVPEKFGLPDSGVAAKASPLSGCSESWPLNVATETSAKATVWPFENEPTIWPLATESDCIEPAPKPFWVRLVTCTLPVVDAIALGGQGPDRRFVLERPDRGFG